MNFQAEVEEVFGLIAIGFEALGALAMVVGCIIATVLAVKKITQKKGGSAAYTTLKVTLGGAILLGLEILVAADLVRTITSKPSMEEALILGIIVLIRTVLSMSIQIEIEGTLPWRRALTTSGAKVVSDQIKESRVPVTSSG